MRRTRFHQEEHENLERWLVSYADFITLLFAFFVVMYAVSQVSEGKYRVLSNSLVTAFRNVNASSGGEKLILDPATVQRMRQIVQTPQEAQQDKLRGETRNKMRAMALDIQNSLGSLVREGKVRVTEGPQGISVEINASVLFASGEAQLGPEAVDVLKTVARELANSDYGVAVEGFTDNTPISTPTIASNWELSVMRATSVVRLFQENGVAPWRLTAIGYGEQRPVASNDDPDGRARNRRVNISVDALVGPAPVPVPLNPATAAPTPGGTPAATVGGQVPPGNAALPSTPSVAEGNSPGDAAIRAFAPNLVAPGGQVATKP